MLDCVYRKGEPEETYMGEIYAGQSNSLRVEQMFTKMLLSRASERERDELWINDTFTSNALQTGKQINGTKHLKIQNLQLLKTKNVQNGTAFSVIFFLDPLNSLSFSFCFFCEGIPVEKNNKKSNDSIYCSNKNRSGFIVGIQKRMRCTNQPNVDPSSKCKWNYLFRCSFFYHFWSTLYTFLNMQNRKFIGGLSRDHISLMKFSRPKIFAKRWTMFVILVYPLDILIISFFFFDVAFSWSIFCVFISKFGYF